MPLIDDHDTAEACLDSWNAQSIAREQLQLVVVDHGVGARRARRLRARLQPHDIWLEVASRDESVLYDRGARAADAPIVLFTEAHCVARPVAAREVLDLFRGNGIDAAVVASGHIATNALARAQAELEREWIATWPAGHPRTLSLRGYAIRRHAYLELGGFQRVHGRFCETALAIAMARSGRRIGRTREAAIDHVNCARIGDLVSALAGCARGQVVWREEVEPGVAYEWLGAAPRRNDPVARRAMLRAIAASPREIRGDAIAFVSSLRASARLRLTRAIAGWGLARIGLRKPSAAYRELWLAAFDLGFRSEPVIPAWTEITREERSILDFPERALAGFYKRERAWRWSGPAALLRLAIPPGHRSVRFALSPLLPIAGRSITVFANGTRVDDVIATGDALEVRLPDDAREQEIVITCRASRAEGDDRLLGLAFVGVSLCR